MRITHACLLTHNRYYVITQTLAHRSRLIIGSDTVVVLGDKILEKPGSKAEAVAMLKSLSGQKHTVVTGVALVIQRTKGGAFQCKEGMVKFLDVDMYGEAWGCIRCACVCLCCFMRLRVSRMQC